MVTTIQVDDAINKIAIRCLKPGKSLAGSLKKYTGNLSKENILNELKDKHDRM